MQALHFGAGNIGRGFIGLILSQNGFEVTFADVSQEIIEEIEKEGSYTVMLADPKGETFKVTGVHGINSRTHPDKVAEAVLYADIITTAVGPRIVPVIGRSLSEGIKRRLSEKEIKPFSIIACENAVGATRDLRAALFETLSDEEKEKAEKYIGFPNSAVDRIVPLQSSSNILDVKVEPFFEWVVEKEEVKGEHLKSIEGIHYVDNLSPYIERKLFTVNTGHGAAAYFGLAKGYKTVLEAMSDPEVEEAVRNVLSETAYYITETHGFDKKEHEAYVDKIIGRFRNPDISDDLSRVGRSPLRKLSRGDRFVAPALGVLSLGKDPVYLAETLANLLKYENPDDPESVELKAYLEEHGPAEALKKYADLPPDSVLSDLVLKAYKK